MDYEAATSALQALSEQLDYIGGPPIELVISGGTALLVMGLVNRPTQDVDVLALAETDITGTINLLPAEKLPDDVEKAAEIVARDLDLLKGWLNSTAATAGQQLPEGLSERLDSKRYGKRLVAHFVSRFDQICLKLHAVVDRNLDSRHLADLLALNPSENEMIAAARWCATQDAGEQFVDWLKSCLEKIGYPNAANAIRSD